MITEKQGDPPDLGKWREEVAGEHQDNGFQDRQLRLSPTSSVSIPANK